MDGMILVTGGAGFIGSHLVDALLTRGHSVRVLDDLSSGSLANLRGADALAADHGARFQFIEGDVRSDVKMRTAVEGCAAVAHLAAVASVALSVDDPVGSDSVTQGGTVNAVRATVSAGASRFVLASSCAVYGDPERLPTPEASPAQPLSPYAEAKLGAEEACREAADAGQLTAVVTRFFNVYGPRQDPRSEYSGVISRFLSAAASGAPVTVYGDGGQTRDFVYVGDVVEALVHALLKPLSGISTVNVGSGVQTSINDLLAHLDEIAGHTSERLSAPARPGEIRDSCADLGRARWVLGWEPTTSFRDGLEATWAWYRAAAAAATGGAAGPARSRPPAPAGSHDA